MLDKPILKQRVTAPTTASVASPPPTTPSPAPIAPYATVNPRDLDRSRAQDAWDNILSIKTKTKDYQAKYGSLARNMPTLIQVNGLAQTLAFLRAKGN